MNTPPAQLDGADVLRFAVLSRAQHSVVSHRVDGRAIAPTAALAICRYANEPGFYLFYCNSEWAVLTDTLHDSMDNAANQAAFEFPDEELRFTPRHH